MRFSKILLWLFFIPVLSMGQIAPSRDYPLLFHDVQMAGVFNDSKTFADCIPLLPANKIDSIYLTEKSHEGFHLIEFVHTFFLVPEDGTSFSIDTSLSLLEHIDMLWDELSRESAQKKGSLINLPHSYVVPGGRFREIYYWDSYFTMLGLSVSGKNDQIINMVKNFAWLIDKYGYIPNGNRTYYLSRSQPPFFALMLQLLKETHSTEQMACFLPQLEKEYNFWMEGKNLVCDTLNAYRRVVYLDDKTLLNRYWDDLSQPRPESYKEDVQLAKKTKQPDSVLYKNIRAACESGWDFSTRWMADYSRLSSLETTSILPVDLNCLLYMTEKTLEEIYQLNGIKDSARYYSKLANKRLKAINKVFWHKNKGFYADYHFVNDSIKSPHFVSGIFPLFANIASKSQARESSSYLIHTFLEPGGVATSIQQSYQQWDYPNGWAPLQYVSVMGLLNYEEIEIAAEISERWCALVEYHFRNSGKLLEKYNVSQTKLPGGGGEYPTQDGFGWTNGVYLKLKAVHKSD